jgi:hypothetical protein
MKQREEEEETKTKKDSTMEESGKDPVWILESPEIGYVLNDQCTSYNTDIEWPAITLSQDLHRKLYPHQKIGVRWLASLHHRAEKFGVGGGLLGDDMVGPTGYCRSIFKRDENNLLSNNNLQFYIRAWAKLYRY